MAAARHGHCSSYLVGGYQYILSDSFLLTVETFWSGTVLWVGSVVADYSSDYTVQISFEIPWSKLITISVIATVL